MRLSPQTIDICLDLLSTVNVQSFVKDTSTGAVQANQAAQFQLQALHTAFSELQAARQEAADEPKNGEAVRA